MRTLHSIFFFAGVFRPKRPHLVVKARFLSPLRDVGLPVGPAAFPRHGWILECVCNPAMHPDCRGGVCRKLALLSLLWQCCATADLASSGTGENRSFYALFLGVSEFGSASLQSTTTSARESVPAIWPRAV